LAAFHAEERRKPKRAGQESACRPNPSKKLDGETSSVIT
jgi:hypothetical protein